MKLRILSFSVLAVVLIAAVLLTGCSALSKAETQIQACLDAISAGDVDAVTALIHPSVYPDPQEAKTAVTGLIELMGERSVTSWKFLSVNVSSNIGTAGRSRQESGTCLVTYDDGSSFQLQYVYLSDNAGEGFYSFNLYHAQNDSSASSDQTLSVTLS